ncbi:MAG TPA: phosphoglycerate dehydrogenase [Bacillales bacterium]|nr:phosphoglycerate dehydrogenase [Bacillales bacterium]
MGFNILVSDPLSKQGIQALLDAEDVQVDESTNLSENELLEVISNYDALLVRSQTKVTEEVLEAAHRLKVVGRAGVGVDNIDLEAASKKGVIVVNAPDGNTISAAEHTFAMMMAAARRIPQAYQSLTGGRWDRKTYRGVELKGKTLGVVGLGRIGAEVAKRARAFHMKVIAYDPFLTEERAGKLGIDKVSLDEAMENADFLTVHTPLIKETHHLIGQDQFEKMKPGVRIVNCARGGIIDETALYEAIRKGKVAGAALDVFEEEPPLDNPLLKLPEVVVTPHLGASTAEAQENVAVDVSEEVLRILRGEPFKNAVNLPPVSSEVMRKLEPYFLLAEKLGEISVQLGKGTPVEVKIAYAGELTDVDTAPLTRTILKGFLSHYLGSNANYVNAPHLAKQHDLGYTVEQTPKHRGFASLVTVTVKTEEDERLVAGTILNGYGPRIVKIDDYSIDISPQDHLLLIRHTDRPGMIGRVGSILGQHEINIGTMQVGRKGIGGKAMMALTVDKKLEKAVIAELVKLEDIYSVRDIEL